MAHPRTFRFGIQASQAATGEEWAALARKAEDLGYGTLFLPDHFGDQLAPVPAMVAAAAATTELRVGALVLDNDYRHPVVLAKELATVDVLSGGRFEAGLGAGWMTSDYEQSGIAHDRPGLRIDRLEEAIAVLKGLWAEGPLDHHGEHYTITGLDGLPKPLQRPHPPLLLGGGGKRMLSIAGREADIVGINPSMHAGVVGPDAGRDATAGRTDEKLAWVRDAAADRFDDIELNMLVFFTMVTDDREGVASRLANGVGVSAEDALEVPFAWIGTIDEICDNLRRWRDRWGVSYWVLQKASLETMAPIVERLAGT